jgi:hypothetical protein
MCPVEPRADSSLVDKPEAKPLHNGLTEFGKVDTLQDQCARLRDKGQVTG